MNQEAINAFMQKPARELSLFELQVCWREIRKTIQLMLNSNACLQGLCDHTRHECFTVRA